MDGLLTFLFGSALVVGFFWAVGEAVRRTVLFFIRGPGAASQPTRVGGDNEGQLLRMLFRELHGLDLLREKVRSLATAEQMPESTASRLEGALAGRRRALYTRVLAMEDSNLLASSRKNEVMRDLLSELYAGGRLLLDDYRCLQRLLDEEAIRGSATAMPRAARQEREAGPVIPPAPAVPPSPPDAVPELSPESVNALRQELAGADPAAAGGTQPLTRTATGVRGAETEDDESGEDQEILILEEKSAIDDDRSVLEADQPEELTPEPEEAEEELPRESVLATFLRETNLRWIEVVSGLCILIAMAIGVSVLAQQWESIPPFAKFMLGAGVSVTLLALAPLASSRAGLAGTGIALATLGLLSLPIVGVAARALLGDSWFFWPLTALSVAWAGVLARPAARIALGHDGPVFAWTYVAAAFASAFAWPEGGGYLHLLFTLICFDTVLRSVGEAQALPLALVYLYSSLAALPAYHGFSGAEGVPGGVIGVYVELAGAYLAVWTLRLESSQERRAVVLIGAATAAVIGMLAAAGGGLQGNPHLLAAAALAIPCMAVQAWRTRQAVAVWVATLGASVAYVSLIQLVAPENGSNGLYYLPFVALMARAGAWLRATESAEMAWPLFTAAGAFGGYILAEGVARPQHGRFSLSISAAAAAAAAVRWPLRELVFCAGSLATVATLLALYPGSADAGFFRTAGMTLTGIALAYAALAHALRGWSATVATNVSWTGDAPEEVRERPAEASLDWRAPRASLTGEHPLATLAAVLLILAIPLLPFILAGPAPQAGAYHAGPLYPMDAPAPMGPFPLVAAGMAAAWELTRRLLGQRSLEYPVLLFLAAGATAAILRILPATQTIRFGFVEPLWLSLPPWFRVLEVLALMSAALALAAGWSRRSADAAREGLFTGSVWADVALLFAIAPFVAAAAQPLEGTPALIPFTLAFTMHWVNRAWGRAAVLYVTALLFVDGLYLAAGLAGLAGPRHALAVSGLALACGLAAWSLRGWFERQMAPDTGSSIVETGRSPVADVGLALLLGGSLLPALAHYVPALPHLLGLGLPSGLAWEDRALPFVAVAFLRLFVMASSSSLAIRGLQTAVGLAGVLALVDWFLPRELYILAFAVLAGAAWALARLAGDPNLVRNLRFAAFGLAAWPIALVLSSPGWEPAKAALATAPLWLSTAVYFGLAADGLRPAASWAAYAPLLAISGKLWQSLVLAGTCPVGPVSVCWMLLLPCAVGLAAATLFRSRVPSLELQTAGVRLSLVGTGIALGAALFQALGLQPLGCLAGAALLHTLAIPLLRNSEVTRLAAVTTSATAFYAALWAVDRAGMVEPGGLASFGEFVATLAVTALLLARLWETLRKRAEAGRTFPPGLETVTAGSVEGILSVVSFVAAWVATLAVFGDSRSLPWAWAWLAAAAAVQASLDLWKNWDAASLGFGIALAATAFRALGALLHGLGWLDLEILALQAVLAVGLAFVYESPPPWAARLLGRPPVRQLALWLALASLLPLAGTLAPFREAAIGQFMLVPGGLLTVVSGCFALINLCVFFFVTAARRQEAWRVYAGEAVLGLIYAYLRLTHVIGVTFFGQVGIVVVSFALLEAASIAKRARSEVFVEPLRNTAMALPIWLAIRALFLYDDVSSTLMGRELDRAALMAMVAAFYGISGRWESSRAQALLSMGFANVSLAMVFRNHLQLENIDFYTIPIGASILGFAAAIRKELTAAQWDNLRLLGLLCLYVAPAAKCLRTADPAEFWVLFSMGLAGFLIGMLYQLRNFFVFGLLFTFIALVSQLVHRIDFSTSGMLIFFVIGAVGLSSAAIGRQYREKIERLVAEIKSWE